ncbi:MAG: FtsW/RodA/SpoVE family cell cycle protein [Bacteroidota bacterium]
MRAVFTYLKGDKVVWMIAFILALFSLVSVYSFTPILANDETGTEGFLFKHFITIITGFALMFYIHEINFKYFSKLSHIGLWVAVILLFVTLVAGVNINSAGRWLVIPLINQKFQTSDFAKLVLIIYVARMLTLNRENLHNFKEGVLPILIPVVLICGLIFPENFSTAAMLFALCLIMMFIGGVNWRYILLIIFGAIVMVAFVILLAKVFPGLLPRLDTWINRIFNFSAEDPRETWQINNALMAIKNGGFWGMGPGNGQLKHELPQAYADFVYASFIEEFGSLGGGFLLLLFLILTYRVIRIASKCEKIFGSLAVLGLCLNLVFMAFVNMAVCTQLVPVTGQNIPIISMGGTSTWFTCIALGVILSVSRSIEEEKIKEEKLKEQNRKKKEEEEEEKPVEGGEYAVA